jgi:hypothetical protein
MISTIVTLLVITLFAVFLLTASDSGEPVQPFEETPSVEILPVGPGQSLVEWDTITIDTREAEKEIEESNLASLTYPWQWLEADPINGEIKVGQVSVNQTVQSEHHTPEARHLLAEERTVALNVVKLERPTPLDALVSI